MKKEKTFKDVEGMLYSYNRVRAEAKDIEIYIDELRDIPSGITGKSGNEVMQGSMTNKFNSTVENEVLQREREIERLEIEQRDKERYVKRVDNMISTLSEDEQQLVKLKYMIGKKHKEISRDIGLSLDGIQSKRKVIVSSLVNFINKNEKHRKNTDKTT